MRRIFPVDATQRGRAERCPSTRGHCVARRGARKRLEQNQPDAKPQETVRIAWLHEARFP